MPKQWRDLVFTDSHLGDTLDRARVDIPPDYILFIYPVPDHPGIFRMYLDYKEPVNTVWERQGVELILASVLLHEVQKFPRSFDYRFNPNVDEAHSVRPRLYEQHLP